MPSRTQLRNECLESAADVGYSSELERSSRQHHTSKIAKEKALSPRAYQSLKFKDKVKSGNSLRPPHADLPFEFAKNGDNRVLVRTKASGNHKQQSLWKKAGKEEDIVKYMSHLPAFLQRGEKLQDNVLNFGVLDWERLEKWKHKQNRMPKSNKRRISSIEKTSIAKVESTIASCTVKSESLDHQETQPSHSHVCKSQEVHSSVDSKPLNGKVMNHLDFGTSADTHRTINKDMYSGRDILEYAKGKEKDSEQKSRICTGTSSKFNSDEEAIFSSKEEFIAMESGLGKPVEKSKAPHLDSANQLCSGKHDGIILLLPRNFSISGCSELSPRASLDGNSAGLNWNSFSDIFSVEEVQSEQSLSDIPHSCPLPCKIELEKDLDIKFRKVNNCHSIEFPFHAPSLSPNLNDKPQVKDGDNDTNRTSRPTLSDSSKGLEQFFSRKTTAKARDLSLTRNFRFGKGRMNRSYSFREGAGIPQLQSTYASFKSSTVRHEASSTCGNPNSRAGANGRAKTSPLRRLIDPLLKLKVAKLSNSVANTQECIEKFSDFSIKPLSANECQKENFGSSMVKAFLQLTVKRGLPLFKFVVEISNDILVSTVKKVSTFGKNNPSWFYTFYSVHNVKGKSGRWKSQRSKGIGSEFTYNIAGQMKVSDPHFSICQNSKEEYMMTESVLYGVDQNSTNDATSELTLSRELAAIVVKMPMKRSRHDCEKFEKDGNLKDEFSEPIWEDGCSGNLGEADISGSFVVILPSGTHGLPNEGQPSSLIDRWRFRGSCDCGGWDIGCKLEVLKNQGGDNENPRPARDSPLEDHCHLFVQEGAKQRRPIFKLEPQGNRMYSVEFDAGISKLQAFSICIAVVNGKKLTDPLDDRDRDEATLQMGDRATTPVIVQGEGPAKYASYPPLSPVGRV
ncbi:hypothetical protein Nepgr_030819 [Nepenthes gracilis]|uniref:Uncharacterized protein n=1 Tax=Nepenthes gracilis TaxID=150966 RepID=A0AAD3TGY7_NEPGR|nr:hypothetical protein Nepgr_030819 [Nepenthes gracilis]